MDQQVRKAHRTLIHFVRDLLEFDELPPKRVAGELGEGQFSFRLYT
jgi:hypothetical protein